MSLLELFDPTGLLKARRKAARKRLRDSVDVHVKPLLGELGFASAQTRAWRASAYREVLSGWGWIRIRENAVDLMSIRWEKYGGARFTIGYASYPINAWKDRDWEGIADFGSLRAGHSSVLKHAWFGRWQDAASAGRLARQRILELEAYRRGGLRSEFMENGLNVFLEPSSPLTD